MGFGLPPKTGLFVTSHSQSIVFEGRLPIPLSLLVLGGWALSK